MPIPRSVTRQVRGVVSLALQRAVARDLEDAVARIFDAAVEHWHEADWITFDFHEVNCTVQLYRWCTQAVRENADLAFVTVQLEWLSLTTAMLDGKEDVATATRPDLRFTVGAVGRSVECKRLSSWGPLSLLYVEQGMSRFVTGNYGVGEPVGYMVGYVQVGPTERCIERINARVDANPDMGTTSRLASVDSSSVASRYRSLHIRPGGDLRLEHLMIDMTG
jgi:hypothetical protein